MRNIPDILESWVNSMNNEFKATSISDGVMTVSCPKWAVVYGHVIIDGTKYSIEKVEGNEITLNDKSVQGAVLDYELVKPFYIHGTPRQTNVDRANKRKNKVTVTPLFYVFEPIEESFNERLNSVERDVDVRVAIMNNYDLAQSTDAIYETSINAMRTFTDLFIIHVREQVQDIKEEDFTYRVTSYPKYGQFIDKSGSTKNIFNEELSGIELRLKLPLWRQDKCEC